LNLTVPNSPLKIIFYLQQKEVTRANKDKGWALDTVILTNEVTGKMKDEISTPVSSGVLIYGLFLEGAAWSKTHARLAESKPKILFDPMPVMHISATLNTDTSSTATNKNLNYICPIYKKPKRTDRTFIATVNLRTHVPPDVWILKGVCLLCDTK
jgi:dynein heavy chain